MVQMSQGEKQKQKGTTDEIDTGQEARYFAGMGKEIVEWLKRGREREGLSQSQAAKKWCVKLRTLQNWEIGRTFPRAEAFSKLLGILGPIKAPAKPHRAKDALRGAKRKRP